MFVQIEIEYRFINSFRVHTAMAELLRKWIYFVVQLEINEVLFLVRTLQFGGVGIFAELFMHRARWLRSLRSLKWDRWTSDKNVMDPKLMLESFVR